MPTKSNTARTVYKVSVDEGAWSRHAYGVENCAKDLRWTGHSVAVQVESRLSDQIHLLNESTIYDELHEISTWDVIIKESGPVVTMGRVLVISQPRSILSNGVVRVNYHSMEMQS